MKSNVSYIGACAYKKRLAQDHELYPLIDFSFLHQSIQFETPLCTFINSPSYPWRIILLNPIT